MSTHQIALGTDMSYLRPTLVAMTSAIECTPGPVDVHVLGVGLSDRAVGILESACRRHPGATLTCHDATSCVKGFPQTAHWSPTSFAPLFAPQFIDGRVLWLDSDTLVVRSLAALLSIDLGADLIAAARELYVFVNMWKGRECMNDRSSPSNLVTSPFPPVDYVNSGVILMDCARIRKSPEFCNGMIGHGYIGYFEPDHDSGASHPRLPWQDRLPGSRMELRVGPHPLHAVASAQIPACGHDFPLQKPANHPLRRKAQAMGVARIGRPPAASRFMVAEIRPRGAPLPARGPQIAGGNRLRLTRLEARGPRDPQCARSHSPASRSAPSSGRSSRRALTR